MISYTTVQRLHSNPRDDIPSDAIEQFIQEATQQGTLLITEECIPTISCTCLATDMNPRIIQMTVFGNENI